MSRKKRKLNKIGRKGRRLASAVAVCAITGMIFSGSANAQVTRTAADVLYRSQTGIYTYNWQTYDAQYSGTNVMSPGSAFTYPTGQVPTTGGSQVYTYDFSSGAINLSASLNNTSAGVSVYNNVLDYSSPSWNYLFPYGEVATTTHSVINSYYAPNWYAVLNANNVTVDVDGSGYAIKTDTGVGSTLNLTGTNQFNGTVQLGTTTGSGSRDGGAYLYSGQTTFNGNLNANLFMGATSSGDGAGVATTSTAIFTTAAHTITSNISESTPTTGTGSNTTSVEFQGNNTISGMVGVDNVYVSGLGVVFNNNVTATALTFSDIAGTSGLAGSAYFGSGADMTGNVLYAGGNSTLTLSNGSNVTGSIINTATDNGTLNFVGSSIVTGGVDRIKNVNVNGAASLVRLNTDPLLLGTTTVNNLAINEDRAVVEVGGLLSANSVTMGGHFSKLELLDRASSYADPTVTGAATGASYQATYAANGMKGALDFGTYNATIGVPATGTQGKGTLEVGDNVNVTFSANPALGIKAVNANNATLVFAGSSTVGGNLGTSATSSNTFNRIWAGSAGATVTFQNDIYVGVNAATAGTAGSLSGTDSNTRSLNVGSGTVNLNGNLYGNLVIGSSEPVSVETSAYTGYGDGGVGGIWTSDGTVNIAHSKTVTGTITTNSSHDGTLNFMGSSSYTGNIGISGTEIENVTFNSDSIGSALIGFTAAIGNGTDARGIYAHHVTIGNGFGELKPVALTDITGAFDYAGTTSMRGWTGGTVANIASAVTRLGNDLVLSNAHDAINFGTAHVTANSFTTNDGALSFTVNSLDQTAGNNAASTPTDSSLLTLSGALTMNGAEKVQVNYVGSLANGGTYTLIDAASVSGWTTRRDTDVLPQVFDNSFSINSSVSQVSGDLIVTADRTGFGAYAANQNYIRKSGTVGSFTNNAGIALGAIAAAGSQTGDMVKVIQLLDIDNYGYGNNAANLAKQVKRLAPIANASLTESAFSSFDLSLNAIDMRMSALRGKGGVADGDTAQKGISNDTGGVWFKGLGSYGKQQQHGEYDGYTSRAYGTAIGFDRSVNENLLLGLAGGYSTTDVDQKDFRNGDTMHIKNYQMLGYLNFDVTSAFYVDGAVSYGLNKYDGSRAAALDRTADASFDGHQFGADLGIGYAIKLDGKTTLTPMASVDYKQLKQDAYTETGAGAISLKVDEQSINRTRLGLGARLATEWANPGVSFRPEVAFHWYHNTDSQSKDTVASFVGGGSSFVTPGVALHPNTWNLSAALTAATKGAFSLQFRYDLDRRTEFIAHTGSITARLGF